VTSANSSAERRQRLQQLQREVTRLREELVACDADTQRFARLEQEGRLTREQRRRLRDHKMHTNALRLQLSTLWVEFEQIRDRSTGGS
jgi:Mg2+ and Co2+ transporter CorA